MGRTLKIMLLKVTSAKTRYPRARSSEKLPRPVSLHVRTCMHAATVLVREIAFSGLDM